MKTLTLILTEEAFQIVKSEATVHGLCYAGGESTLAVFAAKVVAAMEEGKSELVIKTRREPPQEDSDDDQG